MVLKCFGGEFALEDDVDVDYTLYHPQSNGCVERLHGSLLPVLRETTRKMLEWHLQLKYALFALRRTPNRSTGFPPAEIAFGHNLCSPLDLLAEELEPFISSNVKVENGLRIYCQGLAW